MTIFIDRHPYRYEMERVSQMFFPGDKIQVKEGVPDQQEYIYT